MKKVYPAWVVLPHSECNIGFNLEKLSSLDHCLSLLDGTCVSWLNEHSETYKRGKCGNLSMYNFNSIGLYRKHLSSSS